MNQSDLLVTIFLESRGLRGEISLAIVRRVSLGRRSVSKWLGDSSMGAFLDLEHQMRWSNRFWSLKPAFTSSVYRQSAPEPAKGL